MCIRDSLRAVEGDGAVDRVAQVELALDGRCPGGGVGVLEVCLLYTSDAADERSSVDLGGRRIIKKKKREHL